MKKIVIITIFLLSFQELIFSLDTISTKYYPLKVGNSWTYFHVHVGYPPYSSRYKVTIMGTTIIGGHLYYITSSNTRMRVDSIYGRILAYDINGCQWLNSERLIDSLQARFHDSCRSNCQSILTRCTDTSTIQILGISKPSKTFWYFDNFETTTMNTYTKDMGLAITFTQFGSPSYYTDTLKGCVIDGVVYGDTTLVGISPVNPEIPVNYELSQNYPNPFNPVTKIKFKITKLGLAKVVVFNVLGCEITALVNEQLAPGTYEITLDSSGYPSGVYYYKFQINDYIETKKMVLLK